MLSFAARHRSGRKGIIIRHLVLPEFAKFLAEKA